MSLFADDVRADVRALLPSWLTDRPGSRTAYTLIFTVVYALDVAAEAALQALNAWFPSLGTPTALSLHARNRRIVRSPSDTDAAFSARLEAWLDDWAMAGTMRGLAKQVQDFLPDHPRVRIVSRAGVWHTREADGSESTVRAPWDWDSISNPERAGWWSQLWVIVYSTAYPLAGTWGDGEVWGGTLGFGHGVPSADSAALRTILQDWKAAHSHIAAVIWTRDLTDFDPLAPGSRMPDGRWGEWAMGEPFLPTRPDDLRFWEMP